VQPGHHRADLVLEQQCNVLDRNKSDGSPAAQHLGKEPCPARLPAGNSEAAGKCLE
jgi:hypothetical protein